MSERIPLLLLTGFLGAGKTTLLSHWLKDPEFSQAAVIMQGGAALRAAGAEGRAALLALASQKLGVPAAELRVRDGVVYAESNPAKKVSYAELVGGREFDVKVSEKPKAKDPREYRLVGKPVPRVDIPEKVSARYRYVGDLTVPDMFAPRASHVYFVSGATMPSWFATSSNPSRPARVVWSVR